MVPEDYWNYFKKRGVQAVVRLNKKVKSKRARGLQLSNIMAVAKLQQVQQPADLLLA